MNSLWWIALYGMAVLMTAAGIIHFVRPGFYLPIVPRWLPFRTGIIYGSGLLELMAGTGLFLPGYRQEAALLLLGLMVVFLPVHVWDCFRAHPAIGSTGTAVFRIFLQLLLIACAWWLLKGDPTTG